MNYIYISTVLFIIGLIGVSLNRRSIINAMLSIELIMMASVINFVYFSIALDDIKGQIFAISIVTVVASEAAIGLAILIVYFRKKRDINIVSVNKLHG